MFWSKVKTILIVLFVFVNIFLLTMLLISNSESSSISKETISDTVYLLGMNGIEVNPAIIPVSIGSGSVCDIRSAVQSGGAFADVVFKAGNYTVSGATYKSVNGELTFVNGNVNLEFKIPPKSYPNLDTKGIIAQILRDYKLDTKHIFIKDIITSTVGDRIKVSIGQRFAQRDFIGIGLEIYISKSGLGRLVGSQVASDITSYKPLLLKPITATLAEFIKNKDKTVGNQIKIQSISEGYYINHEDFKSEHKSIQAVPCYKIKTSEGRTYLYDARSDMSGEYQYLSYIES